MEKHYDFEAVLHDVQQSLEGAFYSLLSLLI